MGSVSMIVNLKGGSLAANVLVGCMACITIGGLALLISRHVWLRCCGGAALGPSDPGQERSTPLLAQRGRSIPVGARLCDTLLFGADPYRWSSVAERQAGQDMIIVGS